MLITNVHIENNPELTCVRIDTEAGVFSEIGTGLSAAPGEEVIDAAGHMMLPPFIESHVHLDATLTAGDPVWNESGTLFEGIACWAKRKDKLTPEDIEQRVTEVVRKYAAHGIQHIRTHVDVTDPTLMALKTLLPLREKLRPLADIQIVAFPQEGIESFPHGRELMQTAADMGVDALGAIPHFEFTREYSVSSLNFVMKLASECGLLVDVHCDEIDDEASRGLETLAARAYELGMGERVTASHTTAMHSYNNAYVMRLMRLLKMSGINFVANPLVNTHLQGRMDTYPKRRGMTRVKELTEAGINVSFGHDDIFDPWYPLGNGSLRDVVHMGLHVGQMMGYSEIMNSYRFITHNAARTLNISDSYGIEVGKPANFILMDAENWYEALNENAAVLANYRAGRLIARTQPAISEVLV